MRKIVEIGLKKETVWGIIYAARSGGDRAQKQGKGREIGMKTLFFGGMVVNVFTGLTEKSNVLVENGRIIGVGDYEPSQADRVIDITGKWLCPGFVDAHMHIESTMLTPYELTKAVLSHGTCAIVADPHEIANVCGLEGIKYMLEASENLPLDVYVMLPSCVPATPFDESGAVLNAEDLKPMYGQKRVLGLAEMMNYPGVLAGDEGTLTKIRDALLQGRLVNGHAPLLSGQDLDRYIACGVGDDHECTSAKEAMERVAKGQRVLIRQGTAAKNLQALLPLCDDPYDRRCMLATDDRHPADLIQEGHIDHIIRLAIGAGKDAVRMIRLASLQPCEYYGLRYRGAIAPGYRADLLVLDDLQTLAIRDVYRQGQIVVQNGQVLPFEEPEVDGRLQNAVLSSFRMPQMKAEDFVVKKEGELCRVIELLPGELITNECHAALPFDAQTNGIDLSRDIVKLAVIERHNHTGHVGIGFIKGTGMKKGAIASSVSHDSHNLIVIGTNEEDMACAANQIRSIGGGMCVVRDGEVLEELPLPIGGLMSLMSAEQTAERNKRVRDAVKLLGQAEGIEPFMNMGFVSLTVIPHLKLTTQGLVDVDKWQRVGLFCE